MRIGRAISRTVNLQTLLNMNHRTASLTIATLPDGRFFLSGYALGKQVRIKRASLSEVEQLKHELEAKSSGQIQHRNLTKGMHYTVLTPDQLRDAEAAYRILAGKKNSLIQCVGAAKTVLGDGEPKDCMESLTEWQTAQERDHLAKRTIKNNDNRVKRFLEMTKVTVLDDISPAMVEKFVFIKGINGNSELSRVRPIKAWLNFCVAKKYLTRNPCEIDVGQLADNISRSHSKEDRIMTPAQCEALLNAALVESGGLMIPYTVLALGCFMRNAEVQRTTTERIHLDHKVPCVDVFGKKRGGKFRVVTIPANLVPLLRDCAERDLLPKGETVYFNRPMWDRIREAAGLIKREVWTEQDQRRNIIESIWQENLLRHTGESYLYAKTGDIKETTRMAGHSQETAFRHYLQQANPETAAKFFAIAVRFPAQIKNVA